MKLASVLVALAFLAVLPARAAADVELLGGSQSALPNFTGGSLSIGVGDEPDQLWVAAVSVREDVTVDAITHGPQAFTRRVERAQHGTRTEIWTLSNPDTSFGQISYTVSGATPTPARLAVARLGGVHRTDPIIDTETGADNAAATSAAVTLATPARPEDFLVGVLTGADETTMTDLSVSPGGVPWGGGLDDGPLVVRGNLYASGGDTMTWSWTSPTPLTLNAWTAAVIGVRAPDPAALTGVTASSVTQTSASLASSVTGDGDGTVSARGFVYCSTCATPMRGGADVVDVAAGAGTGAFTGAMTGLGRGTSYTVRAYAVNQGGTTYSDPITVTTDPNRAPSATLGVPFQVTEGASLTLSVTATDPDGDALEYAWDLDGDGDFDDATGPAPQLGWDELDALGFDGGAAASVRLRVRDDHGGQAVLGPAPVAVDNAPPSATLGVPVTVAENAPADLSLSGVTDPSSTDRAAGIRFGYDFDDDGDYEVGGGTYAAATTASSATIPAGALDGPGTQTVRVVVIDKDGGVATRTGTIDVANAAPDADAGDVTVDEGDTATIGLTNVTDVAADAPTLRYAYDFDGDGTYDHGSTTYASAVADTSATVPAALTANGPAALPVRLAVVDKDGGVRERTATVHVVNREPTASLADAATQEGTPATLRFDDLADVPGDLAGLTFEWDLDGDGTFEPGGQGVAVPAPDGPATIAVKGAVLDPDGGRSEYAATVTVANAAPSATLSAPDAVPSSGQVAVRVRLADPGDDALTATLEWGDGARATVSGAGEHELTHTYSGPGERTLRLRASDSDGAESAAVTHRLVVAAAPPAPPPTPPAPTPSSPAAVEAASTQAIRRAAVIPRCLRGDNLRARIARSRTMKVRFTLREAGSVRIRLQRLKGKRGASKCPPPRGVPGRDGKRVPGVYRPFTSKAVRLRKGTNTLTVAATGRKGKRLRPGTYLVLIRAGDATARTKLWILR